MRKTITVFWIVLSLSFLILLNACSGPVAQLIWDAYDTWAWGKKERPEVTLVKKIKNKDLPKAKKKTSEEVASSYTFPSGVQEVSKEYQKKTAKDTELAF